MGNGEDVIKALTKSASEEEIKRIWEIGRSRDVEYDINLSKTPAGAEEVMKKLSKNYLLGVVTSRITEGVYESPKLEKLKKYFKVVISYQDTINHKPHPEPLLLAAQKLEVVPKECVYVGDAESDFKAARVAGMKIIIYSKYKFDQADACTSLFTELPELISSLG